MKKLLLLFTLTALMVCGVNAQSDNQNNNPELTITDAGKRLEAVVACLDAIEAPTKYNAFAKPFIELANFPKKSASATSAILKQQIDQYFITHPKLVDKVREEARKANEKFYGPSNYYNN